MGSRHPDRVPMSVRRYKCESVGDMLKAHWDVHARCDTCHQLFRVNLRAVARAMGPGFSLWNRKDRCKLLSCRGWLTFMGRAPEMSGHQPIDAPWPEDKPPAR
jgi:hypothetical protein